MKKTILSLEQALTVPYATQRFAQLGWRVIRIETPKDPKTGRGGDPNRYIGEDTGFDDLHSYYIAPNIGKEAITLNLRMERGRELLKTLIEKLKVDVFICNTLPKRYKQLGIDFETLREANPELIWCGVSAFGPEYPDRAGYDPALQAVSGFMHLTGEPDRDPLLCGLPIIDLKAGDEAFAQIILALFEQEAARAGAGERFTGKRIDVSMFQCAVSWLITALPQLAFVEDETKLFTRSGNEHRSFIPCNCYPTKDGYVYLAIGNDIQWDKFTQIEGFEHLAKPERKTNQGRLEDKENIYAEIGAGLESYTTDDFISVCHERGLAVAPVNTTVDIANHALVQDKMLKTTLPSSKNVSLFPPAQTTEFLTNNNYNLKSAPRLGEDNDRIYGEIGFGSDEIDGMKRGGVV